MATVDELLAGEMTAVEQVLTINWDTRVIDIPKTITNLGVESDDDVKILKFRAPRHYHGTDLSEFTVRINYLNAKKEGDLYSPGDVVVTEDMIEFSWVVGRFATMYRGDVEFNVCMIIANNEGVIDKEVNTTPTFLPVLEGLETVEAEVEDERDVITSVVLEALDRARETDLRGEPGYTPVKGVDYFTPEEREEFGSTLVRDHNGAFANALKGTVSGSVIRVDDVSPIEHTVRARVYSKNRACISKIVRTTSAATEVYGTVLSIRRTNTNETWSNVYIEIGDYSSFIGKTLTVSLNGYNTYAWTLNLVGLDDSNKLIDAIVGKSVTNTKVSFTATVPSMIGATKLALRFVSGNNYVATDDVYTFDNIQVEEGSIATAYEEYIGPENIELGKRGKNLLPYPFSNTTKTLRGVTITENPDGTFVADGTATGECIYFLIDGGHYDYYDGKYTFSGISGGSISTYYIQPVIDGVYQDPIFDTTTLEIHGHLTRLGFYIKTGTTLNNKLFKLQIEAGDKATVYEPYVFENVVPEDNGYAEVSSVYSTMTLLTDTAGMTIEAEYSKDINKQTFGGGGGEIVAATARITNIVLPSSAWVTEADSLHSQVVSIPGITEYSKVDLLPSVQQLAIFHDKDVAFVTENEDGVVTVYAIGDKPTNDYTMQAQITEVSV